MKYSFFNKNILKSTSSEVYNDLAIFSHLRWDFVTQRPQHLANKFAERHRVFFFEEPITISGQQYGLPYRFYETEVGVYVIQPYSNLPTEQYDYVTLFQTISDYFGIQRDIIMWFYSPMFVDILHFIDPILVVYDRMDKLAAFKNAPKELEKKEGYLISIADIIFTGGKSLYEDTQEKHDFVHCFPSSVDKKHFEKALDPATKSPIDILNIPAPRVGFYGVIDERFDIKFVNELANMLPQVSFVFIGPVAKINKHDLPKGKNINFLGIKSYETLPQYLKAIDIALIPFARNESTQYISPTKTLEYMAAHKPIISTPIHDIVRDYADIVKIVSNAAQAKKEILGLLNENFENKKRRIEKERRIVEKTSWENTSQKMEDIMLSFLHDKTFSIIDTKSPTFSFLKTVDS